MTHFTAMGHGPSGPGHFEYPTEHALLVIQLAPDWPDAAGTGPGAWESEPSTRADGSLRFGLAALALAAAGGYLIRMLTARGERRKH
jgi:hypothetical protein